MDTKTSDEIVSVDMTREQAVRWYVGRIQATIGQCSKHAQDAYGTSSYPEEWDGTERILRMMKETADDAIDLIERGRKAMDQ